MVLTLLSAPGTPMLHVEIHSGGRQEVREHASGPLEFGRGPQSGGVPRCVVGDPHVSRDHLRVLPQADGTLQLWNLSHTAGVALADGRTVPPLGTQVVSLPARLDLADDVHLVLSTVAETVAEAEAGPVMETISSPAALAERPRALRELGEAPDAQTLAHWFETLVHVEQAAATSKQFLDATAQAVVDLVGMDRGMVLLRDVDRWRVGARFPAARHTGAPYSTTILDEVVRRRQTVFRNCGAEILSMSLMGVDVVVAAPVLDAAREVVGVVYGARYLHPDRPPPRIQPLEAMVTQVLAAAVGAGLEREEQQARAVRSQVQFEQFFSPQLARELAADASLLEGREREVTLLFTDVRNFSRIAERLGAQRTFVMMQDVMELQSVHIREAEGVVVDYVGDGLLAMWNAPATQADHAARACRAALACLRELPALSRRWEPETREPLRLGVGIHTGPALVGNTGSKVKFKYGPMGPAVNLASRLENATKSLGVSPILSRATRDRLPGEFGTRRLGALRVQGFTDSIDVYELASAPGAEAWRSVRDEFERALGHFEQREWSQACRILASLLARGDDYDVPSLQLLSRAVECMRSRPDPFDPSLTIPKLA